MAGWTRVRLCGPEPREWSGWGAAFRWIYLSVALYRRLPTGTGPLPPALWRRVSAAQRSVDPRDALGLRRLHADARTVLAAGWNDCGAAARALPSVHHVFVARDERCADVVRDNLRGGNAVGRDVRLRKPIVRLDANGGMADVRSSRWVFDDHPADQRRHSCWPPAVRRDGAA